MSHGNVNKNIKTYSRINSGYNQVYIFWLPIFWYAFLELYTLVAMTITCIWVESQGTAVFVIQKWSNSNEPVLLAEHLQSLYTYNLIQSAANPMTLE
jgi:hypothetical protein